MKTRAQRRLAQLEALVQRRTAQLAELSLHLQSAREDERQRLAADLHDELGALLTSAKLDTARIQARLRQQPPDAAVALERLDHLSATLNSVIALKRRIIEDLRPSALIHLGLLPALQGLCQDFADSSGLQLRSALQPVTLSPARQLVLYRALQEALSNVAQHAAAQRLEVRLLTLAAAAPEPTWVELSVQDDGRGFSGSAPARSTSFGLLAMRLRIEAEQGRLLLHAPAGQGCRLQVRLPAG